MASERRSSASSPTKPPVRSRDETRLRRSSPAGTTRAGGRRIGPKGLPQNRPVERVQDSVSLTLPATSPAGVLRQPTAFTRGVRLVAGMTAHLGIHGSLDHRPREFFQPVWPNDLSGRFTSLQLIQCSFKLRPVFPAVSHDPGKRRLRKTQKALGRDSMCDRSLSGAVESSRISHFWRTAAEPKVVGAAGLEPVTSCV